MAARVNVGFQVELGISDTALTNVLTIGDFKTAERIIRENDDPDYLNQGPYEKTPLTLVLSSDLEMRTNPRNLRLAKLLVERGANPNHRIPEAEFRRASASPLQELVSYYLAVKREIRKGLGKTLTSETVGLNDERSLTYETLSEQLLDLLDAFFVAEGDPNVPANQRGTLLHIAVAEEHPDMDLIKSLCDAGADINARDAHGTTPLMDLILSSSIEDAQEVYWYFFCKQQALDVLSQNCMDESVLWRAMFVGATELASHLLDQGADIYHKAEVVDITSKVYSDRLAPIARVTTIFNALDVPALFAPLLEDSRPYSIYSHVYTHTRLQRSEVPFHKLLADKIIDSSISPLVDNQYAVNHNILPEISRYSGVYGTFECFIKENASTDFVRSMFGKLTAGLQQMCVRTIVDHIVFRTNADTNKLVKLFEEAGQNEYSVPFSQAVCVRLLSPLFMKVLIEQLGLPPSLLFYFNVEGARCQIALSLDSFESSTCLQGCERDSDDSDSWDDTSSMSDDSDVLGSYDDSLPSSGHLTDSSYEETVSLNSLTSSSGNERVSEASNCDKKSETNKTDEESDESSNCSCCNMSDLDSLNKVDESSDICDNSDRDASEEVKPCCKRKSYKRLHDDP